MASGCVDSIFKAQCAVLMTSLKVATTLFWIHCKIFFSETILFMSINLDLKHAEPNIGKIFKTNIILITKYIFLN